MASTFDVATWNINSIRPRIDQVLQWLDTTQTDVLCLQETKVVDDDFPGEAIAEAGWEHQAIYGQKTYNGVAILSRHPLTDVVCGFQDGEEEDPQTRLIRAKVKGITVVDCYVPNGSPIASPKFTYKLSWLKRLRAVLDAQHDPAEPLLLLGDLNISPGDADVYDPFEAEGKILFSETERKALADVMGFGLKDAYRKKNPFAAEYSWWDYRGSAFRYNRGFRIDHVLLTKPLMKRCKKVWIDREPRTWERPSDHTPVVARLKDA